MAASTSKKAVSSKTKSEPAMKTKTVEKSVVSAVSTKSAPASPSVKKSSTAPKTASEVKKATSEVKKAPAKKATSEVKKTVKKAPAKKAASEVKKTVKKVTVKKAAPEVKKTVKKASAKKAVSEVKKATVKKAASEVKTPVKKGETAKKTATVKKEAARKKVAAKEIAVAEAAAPEPEKKMSRRALAEAKRQAKKNPSPMPHVRIVKNASEQAIVQTKTPLPKLKLTKAKKEFYRNLLYGLHPQYRNQLDMHRSEALMAKKDTSGGHAGIATHMADLGSDNSQQALELRLLEGEGDVLQMIEEALDRLDHDEYGICIECGKKINPERLEAKPYARYCVACKSRKEQFESPDHYSR